MKIVISFLLAIFIFSNVMAEVPPLTRSLVHLKADKIIKPNDPLPQADFVLPPFRAPAPARDLGERIQAGDTWYDYQSNGSIGKMIVIDEDGGVHIAWMDGEGDNLAAANRNMKYGYAIDDEFVEEDGVVINTGRRGGYGHVGLTTEEDVRAIAYYHAQDEDGVFSGMVSLDFDLGFGAFIEYPLPQYPEDNVYWPQGVMTNEGRIHIVYNRAGADMLSYAGGEIDRGGDPVFSQFPEQIAPTSLNTYRIARSPVSERVAITWVSSRIGPPAPDNWAGFLAYQLNNDLFMVVSEDGEDWNFDDPINVTRTIMPDPDLPGDAGRGDFNLPYCTHDVIFDADDNIHVVFDTRGVWIQAEEIDSPPIDSLTADYSYLWHWSEETDDITPVADGWFTHAEVDDDNVLVRWPRPGAWKSNVCAPSLAFAENGDLYCVFNFYPLNDNSDTYCNGEIYATVSEDNGATWYVPTNITETRTHNAEVGEAECELYPTLAEKIDDFLHISYLLDTDAGTTIQAQRGTEVNTLGFWYYHKVSVDDIARDQIWDDGPSFHREQNPLVMDTERDHATPVPDQVVSITTNVRGQIGDITLVELEWTIDGDLENIRTETMENPEEDETYIAEIPGAESGAFVWYRIRAIDEEDGVTLEPEGSWLAYVVRPEGELIIRDVQFRPAEWNNDFSIYKDYEVTITGVVTTPPEYADEYGAYAIQDAAEDWSGVYIRGVEDVDGIEFLNMGDQVTVTGIVRERDFDDLENWRYQTYIEVTAAEVMGQVELIEPIEVALGDLKYSTRAENLEGVLISVVDVELLQFDYNDMENRYRPLIETNSEDQSWLTLLGMDLELMEEDFFPPISEWRQGTVFPRIIGVFSENARYGISVREFRDMDEVSVPEVTLPVPGKFALKSAYPNPFNAVTKVEMQLAISGDVQLGLFDISGRLVKEILNGRANAGTHHITVDASELSTGIYLLRLSANSESHTLKLVLIK